MTVQTEIGLANMLTFIGLSTIVAGQCAMSGRPCTPHGREYIPLAFMQGARIGLCIFVWCHWTVGASAILMIDRHKFVVHSALLIMLVSMGLCSLIILTVLRHAFDAFEICTRMTSNAEKVAFTSALAVTAVAFNGISAVILYRRALTLRDEGDSAKLQ